MSILDGLPKVAEDRIKADMEWWRKRMDSQPHNPIEPVVEPAWRPEEHQSSRAEIITGTTHIPSKTMGVPCESDEVYRPKHYTTGGIEAIDYIRSKLGDEGFVAYCIGNVLKYISRAGKKGRRDTGTQDLEKAQVYLSWAVEASLGKELTK